MSLITAPFYNRISRWVTSGGTDNVPYASAGMYRGFANDGGSAGQTHTWALNWEAHTGSKLEVIMGSMALGLGNHNSAIMSFQGCPQHIMLQVPLTDGNGLAKTNAGTLNSTYAAMVADVNSAGLDHSKVTMVLGWEAGFGSFDWAIGPRSQTAGQYASAFQKVVTAMRGAGFAGSFLYDMSGMSSATMDAAYPGDSYVDLVGTHHYNGDGGSGSNIHRTDIAEWLLDDRTPLMQRVTDFATAHGKLAFASEWSIELAEAGDTTSNVYKNHTADTNLYIPWIHNWWRDHAYTWAGGCWFNQNLDKVSGVSISEYHQLWYNGTNPASQSPTYPHDTSGTGTVYDSPSGAGTRRPFSTPAHYLSVMVPGTMQIDPAAGTGTGGGSAPVVITTGASTFSGLQAVIL